MSSSFIEELNGVEKNLPELATISPGSRGRWEKGERKEKQQANINQLWNIKLGLPTVVKAFPVFLIMEYSFCTILENFIQENTWAERQGEEAVHFSIDWPHNNSPCKMALMHCWYCKSFHFHRFRIYAAGLISDQHYNWLATICSQAML